MEKRHSKTVDHLWQVFENLPPDKVEALRQKLRIPNVSQVDMDATSLGIFQHNETGEIQAGVFGYLWGQVLEIQFLWVGAELRGRGIGLNLERHLESEAIARSATTGVLDTYDWQALPFYTKAGYGIFSTVEGYGSGLSKYFVRRELA